MPVIVRFVTGHVCKYEKAEHAEFTEKGWVELMTADPDEPMVEGRPASEWLASVRADTVLAIEESTTPVSMMYMSPEMQDER